MVVDSAEEETVKMPMAELAPPTAARDRDPLVTTLISPPSSMVAITKHENNNNSPVIFPPANHENLNINLDPPLRIHIGLFSSWDSGLVSGSSSGSDSDSDSDSDSNSSTTFSPSDSVSPPLSIPKALSVADMSRRVDSWAETLRSKLYPAVRYFWSSIASSRRVLLTFHSAVVVLGFLYFRQRRRLRAGEDSMLRLIGIINKKDEKINQLLDQISRLNQVLLSLHKSPTST